MMYLISFSVRRLTIWKKLIFFEICGEGFDQFRDIFELLSPCGYAKRLLGGHNDLRMSGEGDVDGRCDGLR
jgi:hypothetical protein